MQLSGHPVDYLAAFLGGVLISFTPCVYPLIPISAGFIGASSAGSRLKGFALSLLYVTGVAITYSILGLFAATTGTLFGRISSNPITYLFVGVMVILFGLSMLDLFTLSLPQMIKLPVKKKGGYFASFILGLTSGLIITPCLTPVLGSILAYLAAKKNLFYGAGLLFSFAYGLGLMLILAGTFSSLLTSLPKAGKWSLYIKRFSAGLLIIMGIYFIALAVRRL